LVRRDSVTWARDLCVLTGMLALIAFDFHRDSFINLDAWVLLGMAIACIRRGQAAKMEAPPATAASRTSSRRIFWGATGVSLAMALAIVLLTPGSYLASATLAPKDKGVTIGPAGAGSDALLEVAPTPSGTFRFQQLRMYWASTTVAARMAADHPRLVRAVLGNQPPDPVILASYIEDNIAVLLADQQTTLTLQYRNANPVIAKEFLTAAIDETDRMVLEAAKRPGRQAGQLQRIVLASNLGYLARQDLLTQAAAQELQSDFNTAGVNASFDYIEHPGILRDYQSPAPAIAVLFTLGLALLAGASAAALHVLWLGDRFSPATDADLLV
jgi:hypothetical protein